jgi:hypothetical protein
LIRLGRDFERLGPGIVAVGVTTVVWVLLAVVSHGVDRPPVIRKIEVQPARVPRGGTAVVGVDAVDADGGRLKYEYSAETGSFKAAPDKSTATYTPAERGSVADRITVRVSDRAGNVATASQVVTIEGAAAPAGSAAPSPATPSAENHAPILNGGGTFYQVADRPMTLEATGSDPDGDEITPHWDFEPCLVGNNVEKHRAEVNLKPECKVGTAVLTWTDARGASSKAEWTLQR